MDACLSVGMEMIRCWFARSSPLPPSSHVPQQTAGWAPTKMPAFRWDYWASFVQEEEDSSDEEAAASSSVPKKRGRPTKQRPLLIRISYRRKAILTAAGSFCPVCDADIRGSQTKLVQHMEKEHDITPRFPSIQKERLMRQEETDQQEAAEGRQLARARDSVFSSVLLGTGVGSLRMRIGTNAAARHEMDILLSSRMDQAKKKTGVAHKRMHEPEVTQRGEPAFD